MSNFDEIRDVRLAKLNKLKEKGIDPYPADSNITHTLSALKSNFAAFEADKASVTVGGRVMSFRSQGGLIFFDLFDGTGKFQALLKKNEDGSNEEAFNLFNETVDIGDFVEVSGILFLTKRNVETVEVASWRMLSKSLRPLPEKWAGLQDVEERFRRRYLDALMSDEVRERFITRSKITKEVRRFLDDAGFLEVETPILQPLAGGATAEPFKTHHNTLDIDMFLRIAPELYLKELLVAGFPKVYELGRLFRNEGIDVTHNPEFTTVEFYEAFAQASKHRVLMEEMVRSIAKVVGKTSAKFEEGVIDFEKPFDVISYQDLLEKYTHIKNIFSLSKEEVAAESLKLGIKVDPSYPWEKIIDNIYKKLCRPQLIQPTFIIDYPIQFSPLAKQKSDDKSMIDRFQLVVAGFEIVNAFSELNDPQEQVRRFEEQEKNKKEGDAEAQPNDTEYVEAMEYGMPPAGGAALSLDRITMILTDTRNIKEVIFFPTMRPRE